MVEAGAAPVVHRFDGPGGEAIVRDLWRTDPPTTLAHHAPGPTPAVFELQCPPGASRWMVVEWAPGRSVPLHATATVDYDVVLSGELTLLLESEEIALGPGDAVVLPGVVHGWRAGASGCVLLVTLVGGSARPTG